MERGYPNGIELLLELSQIPEPSEVVHPESQVTKFTLEEVRPNEPNTEVELPPSLVTHPYQRFLKDPVGLPECQLRIETMNATLLLLNSQLARQAENIRVQKETTQDRLDMLYTGSECYF